MSRVPTGEGVLGCDDGHDVEDYVGWKLQLQDVLQESTPVGGRGDTLSATDLGTRGVLHSSEAKHE